MTAGILTFYIKHLVFDVPLVLTAASAVHEICFVC